MIFRIRLSFTVDQLSVRKACFSICFTVVLRVSTFLDFTFFQCFNVFEGPNLHTDFIWILQRIFDALGMDFTTLLEPKWQPKSIGESKSKKGGPKEARVN